jgi:hypothetical protein
MGYVIVEFPERRGVRVNGLVVGENRDANNNYRVLRVEDGVATISLDEPGEVSPPTQTVVVAGTSPIQPLRVIFRKT